MKIRRMTVAAAALLTLVVTADARAADPSCGKNHYILDTPYCEAATVTRVVEYFEPAAVHYFVTANPAEIAALDSGAFAGWYRTGRRFLVSSAPQPGLAPVCRFFMSGQSGASTHFFTANAGECALVKTWPGWTYEGIAFYVARPGVDGRCAASLTPVNRYFNNGAGGAPNHAYAADRAAMERLQSAGWLLEGPVFCVPTADDGDDRLQALAGGTLELGDGGYYGASPFTITSKIQPGAAKARPGMYGTAEPRPSIVHAATSAWSGLVEWDALANGFVITGGSGFEGGDDLGLAWLVDDLSMGPHAGCLLRAIAHYSGPARQTDPLEPVLFSGCVSAPVARR